MADFRVRRTAEVRVSVHLNFFEIFFLELLGWVGGFFGHLNLF
jgi:hypothetical protein